MLQHKKIGLLDYQQASFILNLISLKRVRDVPVPSAYSACLKQFAFYLRLDCRGSLRCLYTKNPTPQNVENMVDAFFSGLKNLFNNLENWFMNMTPGYLRKLANALESRGCRNYSEYRSGIVRSGIER